MAAIFQKIFGKIIKQKNIPIFLLFALLILFPFIRPISAALTSDDFNGSSLNTSLWTFINPKSDASVTVANGQASINLPAGSAHDATNSITGVGLTAPRIMQTISGGDFELEAKFNSGVNAHEVLQGIIFEQDTNNYIRYDFYSENNATTGALEMHIYSTSFKNGAFESSPVRKNTVLTAAPGTAPLYLRAKRTGTSWTLSYSTNGTTWTQHSVFTYTLNVVKIGPFAANPDPAANPPAFTAVVDYFYNTAAVPHPPEIPGDFKKITVDASGPSDIFQKAVGDLNGDGWPDLIAGGRGKSAGASDLVWYEDPNFTKRKITSSAPVSITTAKYSTDGEVVDINKDGKNDYISITTDGKIILFKNTGFKSSGDKGDINWEGSYIANAADRVVHDIEVADFDNNGKMDLVGRNQSSSGTTGGNKLHFYRQNDDGSWSYRTIAIDNGEGLKVADIDGDGDQDIVSNGKWYENRKTQDNDWNFMTDTWPAHTFSASWTYPHTFIDVKDTNNDNRLDIIMSPSEPLSNTDTSKYHISWFKAPLDRTAAWDENIVEDNIQPAVHFIGAADFNKDGNMDIATAAMHQGLSPGVVVYRNDGKGGWVKMQVSTQGMHSMKIVDYDDDGDMDFYGADWSGSNEVVIFENQKIVKQPLNKWTHIQADDSRVQPVLNRSFLGLAAGDVTGDGKKDIFSGQYFYKNPGGNMDSMAAWKGNRKTFPLDGTSKFDALLQLDVDGDANGDVIGMYGNGKVYWMEATNAAGDSWVQRKQIGQLAANESVSAQGYALANVEGDEKPEIIINSGTVLTITASNQKLVYLKIPGNPETTDWSMVTISTAIYPEGVASGDIDGDGDLDIVAPDSASTLAWWENPGNGTGNWTKRAIGPAPSIYADRIYIAKVNEDNKNDIVFSVANGPSNTGGVYWFESPAEGPKNNESWFRHTVANQDSTNSLDVADMDKDGDIDIVSGEHLGTTGKEVAVWSNNGRGQFGKYIVDSNRESHLGTRVFDLDNDGDLDIASIAWIDYPSLRIWRNDAIGGALPPSGNSFLFFDRTYVHTGENTPSKGVSANWDFVMQMPLQSGAPKNWISPVNYADGKYKFRVEVLEIESGISEVWMRFGWRQWITDPLNHHLASPPVKFSKPGIYEITGNVKDLGCYISGKTPDGVFLDGLCSLEPGWTGWDWTKAFADNRFYTLIDPCPASSAPDDTCPTLENAINDHDGFFANVHVTTTIFTSGSTDTIAPAPPTGLKVN